MAARVIHGDCIAEMKALAAEGVVVQCIVTDPPYHLTSIVKRFGGENAAPAQHGTDGAFARASKGFMGKQWDGGDIAYNPETWRLCYDLLPPGGHLVAFGGTRTAHRMVCAIEDAGFEIRDALVWMYGSGFAKSFNLKRAPICDCIDGENPLPYIHDKQISERNVRPLRNADVSAPEPIEQTSREILQPGLSQSGKSEYGATRAKSKISDGKQSSLERRELHRASKGLSDDFTEESFESKSERICSGTHYGGGNYVGPASDEARGSPSYQPRQSGQQAGEFEDLSNTSRTLDDRTLFGRGECERCGKLKKEYEGFGSALKPAHEPICLARKPLGGTVAETVLAHGTGAINVDACRISYISAADKKHQEDIFRGQKNAKNGKMPFSEQKSAVSTETPQGRWPANVILDGSEQVEAAFAVFGERSSGFKHGGEYATDQTHGVAYKIGAHDGTACYADTGSASRFFTKCEFTEDELSFHYSAKANKKERFASGHPTVKPMSVLKWLCRLVCPPGGTVLDPFAGSGTTLAAAISEGFNAIGIEREAEYHADIVRRLAAFTPVDTAQPRPPPAVPEPLPPLLALMGGGEK